MATIKSYTDIEQTKKLAEILPIESADMTYYACVKDWRGNPIEPKWGKPANLTKEELALPCSNFQEYKYVPCWSLAALLGVLPKIVKLETLFIETSASLWHIGYRGIYIARADNLLDACYEMILKLHEKNLL